MLIVLPPQLQLLVSQLPSLNEKWIINQQHLFATTRSYPPQTRLQRSAPKPQTASTLLLATFSLLVLSKSTRQCQHQRRVTRSTRVLLWTVLKPRRMVILFKSTPTPMTVSPKLMQAYPTHFTAQQLLSPNLPSVQASAERSLYLVKGICLRNRLSSAKMVWYTSCESFRAQLRTFH